MHKTLRHTEGRQPCPEATQNGGFEGSGWRASLLSGECLSCLCACVEGSVRECGFTVESGFRRPGTAFAFLCSCLSLCAYVLVCVLTRLFSCVVVAA